MGVEKMKNNRFYINFYSNGSFNTYGTTYKTWEYGINV